MEANEAPEKIYLYASDRAGEEYEDEWSTFPWGECVEYTRTDAFIEKAVEWLENHNDYIDVKDGNVTYFDMEKCVEDFRKAMKGGEE